MMDVLGHVGSSASSIVVEVQRPMGPCSSGNTRTLSLNCGEDRTWRGPLLGVSVRVKLHV